MFCYRCPECAEVLFAPDDEVGRDTLCPKCWKPIRIPEPAGEESEELWDPYDPISVVPLGVDESSDAESSDAESSLSARLYRPEPEELEPFVAPASKIDPKLPEPPSSIRSDEPKPAPQTVRRSGIVTSKAELESTFRLVAALRVRMAPPPIPQSDVRFSTAAWLILTLSAVVLWGVAVSVNPMGFQPTLALGILALGMGFFIVITRYIQSPQRETLRRILPRAAWYAATGGMIITLAVLGPAVRSALIPMVAEKGTATAGGVEPHRRGPVSLLRAAKEQQASDALLGVLRQLAEPDETLSEPDRQALGAELLTLTSDSRPAVRNTALRGVVLHNAEGAEAALVASLRSSDPADRETAIELAPRRASPSVIAAVIELFKTNSDRALVREALIRIGGSAVEQGILPLVNSDQPLLALETLSVLESIGGTESQSALEQMTRDSTDLLMRQAAGESARRIGERLGKTMSRKESNE